MQLYFILEAIFKKFSANFPLVHLTVNHLLFVIENCNRDYVSKSQLTCILTAKPLIISELSIDNYPQVSR